MPSIYETLSETCHGDYTQRTLLDTEEGSLRVTIEGPAGGLEINVESPGDLAGQTRQLEQLAEAIAAARAGLLPLIDSDDEQ